MKRQEPFKAGALGFMKRINLAVFDFRDLLQGDIKAAQHECPIADEETEKCVGDGTFVLGRFYVASISIDSMAMST